MKKPPQPAYAPHIPCRCAVCVHERLLRMLKDLDERYGPWPLDENPEPAKETIQ